LRISPSTERCSRRSLRRCGIIVGVDPRPGLSIDDAVVHGFAARHGVRRLALFGSVELRTMEDLSRYFRDQVAATAHPLYAA
jgi:hypothetical protein